MNADPADTQSPHLDLEDLIAEAAGQPVSAPAREHLARCEQCRTEANRWNLVADGVRGVPAATPEVAQPVPEATQAAPGAAQPAPGAAQPTRPRRIRPRVRTGMRRGVLLAGGAAAAAVVIGVAGYAVGAVHISFGNGPGPVTNLTAVGGCSGIEEATGTLEQASGGSLILKTASGQPVTLTTTASTFAAMSGALVGDIRDGAPVKVTGPRTDGTIAALLVATTPGASASLQRVNQSVPDSVTVQGTVADASAAGFTVVTASGALVPVTTAGDTNVNVLGVSPGQLQAGAMTVALGSAGPDGTLSAQAVVQPMIGVVTGPPGAPGAQRNISISSKAAHDCSPADLAAGALGSAG